MGVPNLLVNERSMDQLMTTANYMGPTSDSCHAQDEEKSINRQIPAMCSN